MEDKIVTLESYYDPMLAEIIRARLEANGISCYIADSMTIGVNPIYNNAVGGVKIKVFEHDVEKCREILARQEELELDDEPVAETVVSCPYCGSANVRYGPATEVKADWLVTCLSALFAVYPFYANKSWHCFNCQKDFEKDEFGKP